MRYFEKVKRVNDIDFNLPRRKTAKSAGYDFEAIETVTIEPYKLGDKPTLVPTGVKCKMEDNEWLMIVNRSSNPKKKNLVIPNSLGVIDADYYNNPDNYRILFAKHRSKRRNTRKRQKRNNTS